jgi:hypothetical protein
MCLKVDLPAWACKRHTHEHSAPAMIASHNIAQQSVQSLKLRLQANGHAIGVATGFIVKHKGLPYLVTNLHVVSGIDPATGRILHDSGTAVPDEVLILHNSANGLGTWEWRAQRLYSEDGKPSWIEHPLGKKVDVIVLPLANFEDVTLYPYVIDEPSDKSDFVVGPADTVSVIGFPFGLSGGAAGIAIWATGFVASEPDFDLNGLPLFLIDCRARKGQSGSAVVAYRGNGSICRTRGGQSKLVQGPGFYRLMGIYSGRVNEESDLGRVWKPVVILQILEAAFGTDRTRLSMAGFASTFTLSGSAT